MKIKSDNQLVSEYLAGDETAFNEIVSRHVDAVYKFSYRYLKNSAEAEDIVQEVFLRVFKNIKKFDQSKKFLTWVLAITKNACLDILRKKKTATFSELEEETGVAHGETIPDLNALPDAVFENSELGRRLGEAMNKLPADYRMVLLLRYNDHLKFKEIGESLGEPLNTVKSRHLRGLKLLRKALGPTIEA